MSLEPIAVGELMPEATLDDCEQALAAVERNAAIQQGVILRHIRDTGLYREKHATFEEYCEKALGYERTWAYRRIDLADTVAMLPMGNITSERQARAIKPVLRDHGPEVAAEVLREAADDDGRITARSIHEATVRVIEPEVLPADVWMDREGYSPAVVELLTAEERGLKERLLAGQTVVVNMRDDAHARLWAWAEAHGLAVRIDRKSIWGNPFLVGDDGTRDDVCDLYAANYFPLKPRLRSTVHTLRGKALGCWCAPDRCHGDHLKAEADK